MGLFGTSPAGKIHTNPKRERGDRCPLARASGWCAGGVSLVRSFPAHAADEMKIVKYPHPALRHKSRPLEMIDKKVRLFAARMLELMYEAKGLGLAANQVDLPFRLLVMNSTADPL